MVFGLSGRAWEWSLNIITFSKLDLEDSMETLVEEVQLHDSQITELNSNDAVQDDKISALETALNGNKTTVLSKESPLDPWSL